MPPPVHGKESITCTSAISNNIHCFHHETPPPPKVPNGDPERNEAQLAPPA